jgi:hypothetical protein
MHIQIGIRVMLVFSDSKAGHLVVSTYVGQQPTAASPCSSAYCMSQSAYTVLWHHKRPCDQPATHTTLQCYPGDKALQPQRGGVGDDAAAVVSRRHLDLSASASPMHGCVLKLILRVITLASSLSPKQGEPIPLPK